MRRRDDRFAPAAVGEYREPDHLVTRGAALLVSWSLRLIARGRFGRTAGACDSRASASEGAARRDVSRCRSRHRHPVASAVYGAVALVLALVGARKRRVDPFARAVWRAQLARLSLRREQRAQELGRELFGFAVTHIGCRCPHLGQRAPLPRRWEPAVRPRYSARGSAGGGWAQRDQTCDEQRVF